MCTNRLLLPVGGETVWRFKKISPVVYADTMDSGLFMEDDASVDLYSETLKSLAGVALDEEESRRLITDIVS